MAEKISIGIMAEKCGITIKRLRDWCDANLVEYDTTNRGRIIDLDEIPKIQRIIELFDEPGTNRTKEDVRQILIDEKMIIPVAPMERQITPEEMLEAMGKALNERFATKEDLKALVPEIVKEISGQLMIGGEVAEKEDINALKEEMKKMQQEMEQLRKQAAQPAIDQDELLRRIEEDIIKKRDEQLVENLKMSMKERADELPEKTGFKDKVLKWFNIG